MNDKEIINYCLENLEIMDKNTLVHTTWECKYHIVFAPKYRRQVIYGRIKQDVGQILSILCKKG